MWQPETKMILDRNGEEIVIKEEKTQSYLSVTKLMVNNDETQK